MHAVLLRRSFDPDALLADYVAVRERVPSLPAGYPGEGHVGWSGICLHSAGTSRSALWDNVPYTRGALAESGLNLRLVRFLSLEPGGTIREHHDSFLSKRIARLHVPIVTHPDVEFYLDGERCSWCPGELWYGDFSRPHAAVNGSPVTRVHLVLDVTADQRFLDLFPPGKLPEGIAQTSDDTSGLELEGRIVERFACDFTLPPGFSLPGAGYEPLSEAVTGKVRLVDSELCVFVNEQPLLKAVAVSEDTLDLIGLGLDVRLHYAFDDDLAKQVLLTVDSMPVLPLDVRPAH
jgi:aspartyl/asparaginyl beta-hydroxylase (cupin superfamily)